MFCQDCCIFDLDKISVHFFIMHLYCFFVTEEDGKAVPGSQERAEGVPAAAGLWFLAGQAFF